MHGRARGPPHVGAVGRQVQSAPGSGQGLPAVIVAELYSLHTALKALKGPHTCRIN